MIPTQRLVAELPAGFGAACGSVVPAAAATVSDAGEGAALRSVPQLEQKRAAGSLGAPQVGQNPPAAEGAGFGAVIGVPHLRQYE